MVCLSPLDLPFDLSFIFWMARWVFMSERDLRSLLDMSESMSGGLASLIMSSRRLLIRASSMDFARLNPCTRIDSRRSWIWTYADAVEIVPMIPWDCQYDIAFSMYSRGVG